MGALSESQNKWLQGLGVDTAVPARVPNLDLNSPEARAALMKGVLEQSEKDRQAAEQKLATVAKTLADIDAYVAGLSAVDLQKASYATIMTEVRKRFPEAAGLSQWVKETAVKVPALKGKLPSPKALMDTVQAAVKARGAEMGWSLATGKDMGSVNTDRLLAAYMSELPAGVTVRIDGGVVKLALDGAALAVKTPAGEVDASAGKGGAAVVLKNDDFTIKVSNDGWKEFDPELRGQWQRLDAEAATVLSMKAGRDKARLDLEQKKKGGAEVTAALSADFDKREAEFDLAWKKLQEEISVTAKASEKKLSASVAYLKKDKNDKQSVKAGADAEFDLKDMQAKLKAYYADPNLKAALEVTAAADKVAAKLEITAIKSGVVVTADFEKALDEIKGAIKVVARDGKTELAVELKKKADELSGKLSLVHETKDLKLAAELEATLKEMRGSIEVAYTKGATTVKGGVGGSTDGKVTGTAQIEIALHDGRTFTNEGDKLSFTANVSNKGYKFEVAFSMGEPVDAGSLQDLFSNADRQIKELYRLAGDNGIRSIDDAKALNDKLQDVMKPVKDSAAKAKTLRGKAAIAASFGFSIEGDWPAGGKASPPAGMFAVKIAF